MSEHHAWVCDKLYFSIKPMSLVEYPANGKALEVIFAQHSRGEHFVESAFEPVARWHKRYQGYARKLPDVFRCNGLTVVSAKARDVFLAHEIGQTSFLQLKLYEVDGVTLYSDQLYFLNFGERKATFVPELSPQLRMVDYQLNSNFKALPARDQRANDQVVLNASALEGVDLWTEPLLFGGIFFSDRLHTAMRRARIDKPFLLSRCLIKS